MRDDEATKKNALKAAARRNTVALEEALATGDLDARRARVRDALAMLPLASERLKSGSIIEPKAKVPAEESTSDE